MLKQIMSFHSLYYILALALTSIVFLSQDCFAEAQPEIKVVFMEGLEPLCWEENGQPMGLQPEITQYVLSKLGIKAQYLFLPWARAQHMIENGEADLMMTMPTKSRFAFAVFGKEMTTPNYWNVFIKKNNVKLLEKAKNFQKLEDLKPYLILDFIGNGWSSTYLKESEGYKVDRSPLMEQIVRKLVANRGDLTINSSTSVNWFLHKLKLVGQLEEIDIVAPGTRFHMTFQVSRKSPWVQKGLVKALDIELRKMKKSGEWLKILRKYKNPYANGKPFNSLINTEDFYKDYESYPTYVP